MKTQSSARPFGFIRLTVALLAAMVFGVLGTTSASAAPLTINVIGVDANGVQTPVTDQLPVDGGRGRHQGVHPRSAGHVRQPVVEHAPKLHARRGRRAGAVGSAAHRGSRRHSCLRSVAAPGCLTGISASTLPSATTFRSRRSGIRWAVRRLSSAMAVRPPRSTSTSIRCRRHRSPSKSSRTTIRSTARPTPRSKPACAGFTVKLIEAGGTYGMSGGEVTQDGFGNPLGTTYHANGNVAQRGKGIILTDANGQATIKNLFPGKYTILVVPPNGSDWHQTSTIEGTRGIDAWVKNNEPSVLPGIRPSGRPRVRRLHEVRLHPGKQPKRGALSWLRRVRRRCRTPSGAG